MAEIRKSKPGKGGHIAEAVARAMGEPVRPITPGGSPDPSKSNAPKSMPVSLTATSFMVSDTFLLPAAAKEEDEASD